MDVSISESEFYKELQTEFWSSILENGKMKGFIPNGSDADWSDEDGVKSGSATGISEIEADEKNTRKQQAIITAKSLNGYKYDPVNIILDKIDAELTSLTKSQSSSATGSTVVRKSGGKNRRTSGGDQDNSRSGSHRSEGTDTGLGTSSLQSELDHMKKNGSVEMYSDAGANLTDLDEDGQKKAAPSDLDSVCAQQVDEKFKEIMKKKKGGYLDNLRAGPGVSDTETIKTEDYEKKFREALVTLSESDTLENDDESRTITISDVESDRNGDLSWGYFDSVPKYSANTSDTKNPKSPKTIPTQRRKCSKPGMKMNHMNKNHRRSHTEGEPVVTNGRAGEATPPLSPRRDRTSTPPVYPRVHRSGSPTSPRRSGDIPISRRRAGYISDADSIKTEDFEIRFHDLIVQQPSESEAESVDPLHSKVKEVLRATAPYKPKVHSVFNVSRSSGEVKSKRQKRNSLPFLDQSNLFNWNDPFWDTSRNKDQKYRNRENVLSSDSSTASSLNYVQDGIQTSSKSNNYCETKASSDIYPDFSTDSVDYSTNFSDSLSVSTSNVLISDFQNEYIGQAFESISSQPMNYKNSIYEDHDDNFNRRNRFLHHKFDDSFSKPKPKRSFSVSDSIEEGRKNLIIPEDEIEYPFARYTFNKKPEIKREGSCGSEFSVTTSQGSLNSSSEISSRSSSFSKRFNKSTSSVSSSLSCTSGSVCGDFDLQSQFSMSDFGQNNNSVVPDSQSSFVSANTANMFYPHLREPISDQFFYDLGFGGVESFLPERFAKDWYNKIRKSQQDMMQQQMLTYPYMTGNLAENSIYDKHRKLVSVSRTGSRPLMAQENANISMETFAMNDEEQTSVSEAEGKSTINKIREILQNELVNQKPLASKMQRKRRKGALTRQFSLPAFLDTLNEEKETMSRSSKCSDTSSEISNENVELNSETCKKVLNEKSEEKSYSSVLSKGNVQKISQKSLDKASIPTISVGSVQHELQKSSTESLEVAQCFVEIHEMEDKENGSSTKEQKSLTKDKITFLNVDNNGRFLTPSPSIASGTSNPSPCISSPVTVIEVGLDNQNDSLDVMDSSSCNLSKERIDFLSNGHQSLQQRVMQKCTEEWDSGRKSPIVRYLENSSQHGGPHYLRRNSCIDNMSTDTTMLAMQQSRRLSLPGNHKSHSACHIQESLENNMAMEFRRRKKNGSFQNGTNSSSSSVLKTELKSIQCDLENSEEECALNTNEICVQADDGKLPPLCRISEMNDILKYCSREMEDPVISLCEDKETQCDDHSEWRGKHGGIDLYKNLKNQHQFNSKDFNSSRPIASSSRKNSLDLGQGHLEVNKKDMQYHNALQIFFTSRATQTDSFKCWCCCHRNERLANTNQSYENSETKSSIQIQSFKSMGSHSANYDLDINTGIIKKIKFPTPEFSGYMSTSGYSPVFKKTDIDNQEPSGNEPGSAHGYHWNTMTNVINDIKDLCEDTSDADQELQKTYLQNDASLHLDNFVIGTSQSERHFKTSSFRRWIKEKRMEDTPMDTSPPPRYISSVFKLKTQEFILTDEIDGE